MSDTRDIIDAIRKICGIDQLGLVKVDICTVLEVNEAERTISCKSIFNDGQVSYTDVRLSAEANDGLICIPDLESTVITLQLVGKNDVYVLQTSDVKKVICVIDGQNKWEFDATGFSFNGGINGGLVKVNDITTKLNLLVSQMQAQLVLIAAGIVSAGGTYTPGTLTTFSATDYKNDKVKH